MEKKKINEKLLLNKLTIATLSINSGGEPPKTPRCPIESMNCNTMNCTTIYDGNCQPATQFACNTAQNTICTSDFTCTPSNNGWTCVC
jgi:hypothetical protein